jgi:hypothetical protein
VVTPRRRNGGPARGQGPEPAGGHDLVWSVVVEAQRGLAFAGSSLTWCVNNGKLLRAF